MKEQKTTEELLNELASHLENAAYIASVLAKTDSKQKDIFNNIHENTYGFMHDVVNIIEEEI